MSDPDAPGDRIVFQNGSPMRTQRLVVPVVAGIAVFGTVSAFAASLNLTSDDLGSNEVVVAACAPAGGAITDAVNVGYGTSWSATAKRYDLTSVDVRVPAASPCIGQLVQVSLLDATGTALVSTVAQALAGASTSISLPTSVDPQLVEGVAVVVAG